MLDQFASSARGSRVIELAEGIHPVIPVLELGAAQDILHGFSAMFPHQRKRSAVLVFKRTRRNSSTIRAQNVGPGGVSRKVWFHFDLSLRDVHWGRRGFGRQVGVAQLVCIRVGRGRQTKDRPELVGCDDLVANQFVCEFREF